MDCLTIGEAPGRYTLVLSPGSTLTFDRCGRALGRCADGLYTARGLDGRCVEKRWVWESPRIPRHLRALSPPEAERLREQISRDLLSARRALPALSGARSLRWIEGGRDRRPDPAEAGALLEFLSDAFNDRWERDARRFGEIWGPIGILPPDQYLSLVVQITEGCAWNRCAYCALYATTPFRTRAATEVREQMDRAEAFLGPALAGRCSVFLGAANALQAPPERVIAHAREIARRFPGLARPREDGIGGIYAFAEPRSLSSWSDGQLRRLAGAGFRRAYLGLETGADDLRREVRKPGSAAQAASAAARVKAAGIGLGVIVLLGLGGRASSTRHVRDTARLLAGLPLGPGDLVYFSPLRPPVREEAPGPMTEEELQDQRDALEALFPRRGERRALYDIREFVY